MTVEIQSRDEILQRHRLSLFELLRTRRLRIEVPITVEDVIAPQPLAISVLIWTAGIVDFLIRSVEIESISADGQAGGTTTR